MPFCTSATHHLSNWGSCFQFGRMLAGINTQTDNNMSDHAGQGVSGSTPTPKSRQDLTTRQMSCPGVLIGFTSPVNVKGYPKHTHQTDRMICQSCDYILHKILCEFFSHRKKHAGIGLNYIFWEVAIAASQIFWRLKNEFDLSRHVHAGWPLTILYFRKKNFFASLVTRLFFFFLWFFAPAPSSAATIILNLFFLNFLSHHRRSLYGAQVLLMKLSVKKSLPIHAVYDC